MVETVLGLIVMLGAPVGYVWLQLRALRTWRGAWLVAGLVPLGIVVPAAVTTWTGLRDGQTLAPLLLLSGLGVAVLWLVLAGLLRARLTA